MTSSDLPLIYPDAVAPPPELVSPPARHFSPAEPLCRNCGLALEAHDASQHGACPSGFSFVEHQRRELVRAREKFGPICSIHAGYAIILEELEEFWDEVKRQSHGRNLPKMCEELIQVAAMAQCTFEDLRLGEGFRPR